MVRLNVDVLELMLVFVILWKALDVWVALVTVVTVVIYITYTMWVTEWRIKFRRAMNEEDSRANTRAIDSLLNYETVKYFGNEEHEARRYDDAMRGYESASIKSQTSLALLNIIQWWIGAEVTSRLGPVHLNSYFIYNQGEGFFGRRSGKGEPAGTDVSAVLAGAGYHRFQGHGGQPRHGHRRV